VLVVTDKDTEPGIRDAVDAIQRSHSCFLPASMLMRGVTVMLSGGQVVAPALASGAAAC
jgi:hypothetical protein